jgi:hypothetical protein
VNGLEIGREPLAVEGLADLRSDPEPDHLGVDTAIPADANLAHLIGLHGTRRGHSGGWRRRGRRGRGRHPRQIRNRGERARAAAQLGRELAHAGQ